MREISPYPIATQVSRRGALFAAAGVGAALADGLSTPPATAVEATTIHPAAPTISQAELDAAVVIASPVRFSEVDPTGTSDSALGLQKAINDTPEGGTLVVPAGTYLVSTEIYPRLGKSMKIVGYGATLVQTTNRPVVAVSGTYDQPIGVSQIAVVAGAGTTNPVARLTLNESPPWSAGDVVKLVSDDLIEGARPGDGILESRRGEFAVVRSVSADTVHLNGPLVDSYATNVRVARISRQTLQLEGLSFTAADGRMGSTNFPLLMLSRLTYPTVRNVSVVRASGTAMHMTSCYGYLIEDCQVGNAVDNTSAGIFGYGVLDTASAFGEIRGGVFRYVRHAYTDDTNRVAAGSDVGQFGRTFATLVSGVRAHMTTNAAFDTHHCSRATRFVSCSAVSGSNIGSGQCGFQLRGFGHTVTDCEVMNCDIGIQVLTETNGGDTWGHTIEGVRISGARAGALRVQVRTAGHPQALKRDTRLNARFSNVVARDCGFFLAAYNSTVDVTSSYYGAPVGAAGSETRCVFGDNSRITFTSTVFDFEANSAGTPRVISSSSTAGSNPGGQETVLLDCEIRATDSVASRAWGAVNGPAHTLRARNLRFTYPFRYMPGENLAPASEYTWYCDRAESPRSSPSSATFVLSNADWQGHLNRIVMSADLALFLNLTTTTDLVVPSLPAARIPGQVIVISHSGSGTFKLTNGSAARTKLIGNTDRVLVKGDLIRLTWNGAVWLEN